VNREGRRESLIEQRRHCKGWTAEQGDAERDMALDVGSAAQSRETWRESVRCCMGNRASCTQLIEEVDVSRGVTWPCKRAGRHPKDAGGERVTTWG
jgi:hypothetical protein